MPLTEDYDEEEDDTDETRPALHPSTSSSTRSGENDKYPKKKKKGRFYEEDDFDEEDSNNIAGKDAMTVVRGPKWRHPLCSCFDVLTQATCWMGFFCTPVLIAQLITRLKLNWKGMKDSNKEEVSLSFSRIVISAIVVLLLGYIPVVGFFILLLYWLFVVAYIGTNVRYVIRRKYKIKAVTRFDDCCLMTFCGCCSAVQMARQTHNDKEYPGYCCTTNGLEPTAPSVV